MYSEEQDNRDSTCENSNHGLNGSQIILNSASRIRNAHCRSIDFSTKQLVEMTKEQVHDQSRQCNVHREHINAILGRKLKKKNSVAKLGLGKPVRNSRSVGTRYVHEYHKKEYEYQQLGPLPALQRAPDSGHHSSSHARNA